MRINFIKDEITFFKVKEAPVFLFEENKWELINILEKRFIRFKSLDVVKDDKIFSLLSKIKYYEKIFEFSFVCNFEELHFFLRYGRMAYNMAYKYKHREAFDVVFFGKEGPVYILSEFEKAVNKYFGSMEERNFIIKLMRSNKGLKFIEKKDNFVSPFLYNIDKLSKFVSFNIMMYNSFFVNGIFRKNLLFVFEIEKILMALKGKKKDKRLWLEFLLQLTFESTGNLKKFLYNISSAAKFFREVRCAYKFLRSPRFKEFLGAINDLNKVAVYEDLSVKNSFKFIFLNDLVARTELMLNFSFIKELDKIIEILVEGRRLVKLVVKCKCDIEIFLGKSRSHELWTRVLKEDT